MLNRSELYSPPPPKKGSSCEKFLQIKFTFHKGQTWEEEVLEFVSSGFDAYTFMFLELQNISIWHFSSGFNFCRSSEKEDSVN